MKRKLTKLFECSIEKLFLLSAVFCILALGTILVFVFFKGAPVIGEIGVIEFITGTVWQPQAEIFGILPMIVSSVYITLGTMVLAIPIGVLTAAYLAYLAPKGLAVILRRSIDILASIPSVVYGFFGLMTIVPLIDEYLAKGKGGNSMLAAIIILTIMVLPTIVSVSETSLRSVSNSYREASLALGATEITTIFKVMVPAAKSGIFSSVILGVGRVLGEAMAVILVSGNAVQMPTSLLSRVRTLSANCALEMGYAEGMHNEALYATGVVLFAFIIILNILMYAVKSRSERKG